MVQLNIYSYRGNHNSRFFNHAGYLGLTPVKIDGVVRTRLDDSGKPLLASSLVVSVRCIELRHGHIRVVQSNVLAEYNQVLWTKPDDVEYGELGNSEHHFKIVIPIKTPGFSYANFQDYRVFWRVEAVITHAPIFGVGTRQVKGYEIPLLRYDTSVPRRQLNDNSQFLLTHKPRAPVLRYRLLTPDDPIGPSDIVSIPLTLSPLDSSVTVRSVSLVVERRLQFTESHPVPAASTSRHGSLSPYSASDADDGSSSTIRPHDAVTPAPESSSVTPNGLVVGSTSSLNPYYSTSTLRSGYTADSLTPSAMEHRPLLQPITTDFPAKTVTLTVHAVDGIGHFIKDSHGAFSKTLTFQWPGQRPNSHWAMGETMQTEMVSVRFFLHVKVIVSSSYSSAETIELEERELYLVSTNESERKVATAKYQEVYMRSKSKSPKRGKRGQPPTPPHSPNPDIPAVPLAPQSAYPLDDAKNRILPSKPISSASSTQPLRRPHTSAGPRDKSSSRSHHAHRHHHDHGHHVDKDIRERHESRTSSSSNHSSSSFLRLPRRPGTSSAASPSFFSSEPPTPPKKSGFLKSRSSRNEDRPWNTQSVRTSRSTNTSGYSSSSSVGIGESVEPDGRSASDPGSVRAWEEELERIELHSRRVSANMLGFKRQRTSATARPNTSASLMSSATSASTMSLS